MVHSKFSFWAHEAPVSASSYDQQLGDVSADNDLNIWPGKKRRDPIGNLLKVGKLSGLGDVCTLDELGSFLFRQSWSATEQQKFVAQTSSFHCCRSSGNT